MAINQEVQSDPIAYLEAWFSRQDAVRAFRDFPLVNIHKFFTQKLSVANHRSSYL